MNGVHLDGGDIVQRPGPGWVRVEACVIEGDDLVPPFIDRLARAAAFLRDDGYAEVSSGGINVCVVAELAAVLDRAATSLAAAAGVYTGGEVFAEWGALLDRVEEAMPR